MKQYFKKAVSFNLLHASWTHFKHYVIYFMQVMSFKHLCVKNLSSLNKSIKLHVVNFPTLIFLDVAII